MKTSSRYESIKTAFSLIGLVGAQTCLVPTIWVLQRVSGGLKRLISSLNGSCHAHDSSKCNGNGARC